MIAHPLTRRSAVRTCSLAGAGEEGGKRQVSWLDDTDSALEMIKPEVRAARATARTVCANRSFHVPCACICSPLPPAPPARPPIHTRFVHRTSRRWSSPIGASDTSWRSVLWTSPTQSTTRGV